MRVTNELMPKKATGMLSWWIGGETAVENMVYKFGAAELLYVVRYFWLLQEPFR